VIRQMYDELFYKRLIELREKKGVSARDMSLSLGQSNGYINRLENRHMLPSMTVFFYICDYFRITPKEFFDDGVKNPALLEELLSILKKLDDDDLNSLLSLAKKLKK
jgi:transcriptional regulator with XRE-family HTH domain